MGNRLSFNNIVATSTSKPNQGNIRKPGHDFVRLGHSPAMHQYGMSTIHRYSMHHMIIPESMQSCRLNQGHQKMIQSSCILADCVDLKLF